MAVAALLGWGCRGAAGEGGPAAPGRDVGAGVVLAEAVAAHGRLDGGAPLKIVKRTRLFAADATLDTCYFREVLLAGEDSRGRAGTNPACGGYFAPGSALEGVADEALAGEALREAYFTATLPWRLLDEGAAVRRLPDTLVGDLSDALGIDGGSPIRRLAVTYPGDPRGERFVHYFDAVTKLHAGYRIDHADGPVLVANDSFADRDGVRLIRHRTTYRLDSAGRPAWRRADFTYGYPDGPAH